MAATAHRPATALNDMELAELAGVGDRTALGELARRHGPGVQALLRRAGAEPRVAEAVARRAFLTAFERMAEFRGQGAFASWIRRLAARHYLAGRKALGGPSAAPASLSQPPDGENGREPSVEIDALLDALDADERLCVCVCCGAGLPAAEVAAAIARPVEAVRSSLHQGLHILRSRLDPQAREAASGSEFERRLERALAEATSSADGSGFARDLELRLARVWAARRGAIALAGAGSAVFAVWRIAASSLATRLEATVRSPFALLGRRFGVLDSPVLRLLPFSVDALWLVAGLVLLAAGLLAMRLFDEP